MERPGCQVSYAELSIFFILQGFRLEAFEDEHFTFRWLFTKIKSWFGILVEMVRMLLSLGNTLRIVTMPGGRRCPADLCLNVSMCFQRQSTLQERKVGMSLTLTTCSRLPKNPKQVWGTAPSSYEGTLLI